MVWSKSWSFIIYYILYGSWWSYLYFVQRIKAESSKKNKPNPTHGALLLPVLVLVVVIVGWHHIRLPFIVPIKKIRQWHVKIK